MSRSLHALLALAACTAAQLAHAQIQVTESAYAEKLRGMWLAQCIANWTGLRTEGVRNAPPFFTDADWGTTVNGQTVNFVTNQSPWGADDDTDIEYVYLHALSNAQVLVLTPPQVRSTWIAHINRFIWVSNANARGLMDRGCVPPSTSLALANPQRLAIDAQLTTEFFGAFAPGSPALALAIADTPITTTASGYAAHAAQFYVALYALAPVVPQHLSPRDQCIWLVQQATTFVPPQSKTADIANRVLADYLANPDANDWESTRDMLYQRYQANAAANGFLYRGFFESSLNFGTGLLALLYGEGNLRRTIQIGTLSGWDSDNGTATMGGLLGLMQGEAAVRAAFAPTPLAGTFWAGRTRDNLPDAFPALPEDDTFERMALRMLPLARAGVLASGGSVEGEVWTLPTLPTTDPLLANPRWRDYRRSATHRVRGLGGTATGACSVPGNPVSGRGTGDVTVLCNGFESNGLGPEEDGWGTRFLCTQRTTPPAGDVWISVTYSLPVLAAGVRFIEGETYSDGGWFDTPPAIDLLINGVWVTHPAAPARAPAPAIPFEFVEFRLPQAVLTTGVRLRGQPGGIARFITAAELDLLLPHSGSGWDVSPDLACNTEDLHVWEAQPTDVLGDGVATPHDRQSLAHLVRMGERKGLLSNR